MKVRTQRAKKQPEEPKEITLLQGDSRRSGHLTLTGGCVTFGLTYVHCSENPLCIHKKSNYSLNNLTQKFGTCAFLSQSAVFAWMTASLAFLSDIDTSTPLPKPWNRVGMVEWNHCTFFSPNGQSGKMANKMTARLRCGVGNGNCTEQLL
jgi:hypothetical protein